LRVTRYDPFRRSLEVASAAKEGSFNDSKTANRCLIEREIVLLDDQVRRMAEQNRSETEPMAIRTEEWDEATAAHWDMLLDGEEQSWADAVQLEIAPWVEKLGYKPKDVPDPESVVLSGVTAKTPGEYKASGCGMMYMGVDGTTHGRCAPICLHCLRFCAALAH
jgi:hypothetical protein